MYSMKEVNLNFFLDFTHELAFSFILFFCTYQFSDLMGDYRYTELSYKITSLIARACCLGSSGLTYTQADAGVMPFICYSYRNMTTKILSKHFNYLFLMLLISLEATTPHVRRCPFILAVLYTQVPTVDPPNRWPGRKD